MQSHAIFSVPGHNPRGRFEFSALKLQLNNIDDNLPVLAASPSDFVRHTQLLRRIQAHERSVVPSQPSHRLWQFLQPSIVCEPAVINRRVGLEYNLQVTGPTVRLG